MKPLLILCTCFSLFTNLHLTANPKPQLELITINKIVTENMQEGLIPGLALAVIQNGEIICEKGYGFTELERQKPVTSSTLFEIGSTTKAFTGFAILKLAEEGKIDLEAPVQKYLPWFYALYNDQPTTIRLRDCLYHTSGIPSHTITNIPEAIDQDALEQTVKLLMGINLKSIPSERFEYATINYDILGLVIQTISNQTYEAYMLSEVLHLLNLHSSFFIDQLPREYEMAMGYKIGFLYPHQFTPPRYRGNAPAAYLLTNVKDMSKWLLHQMGRFDFSQEIVKKSHQPNIKDIPDFDDAKYAAGWFIFTKDEEELIGHSGNNPNFSSFITFSPKEKSGVIVLANLNSTYTLGIGQTIMAKLLGQEFPKTDLDIIQYIDKLSVLSIGLCSFLSFFFGYAIFKVLKGINKNQRKWVSSYRSISLILSISFAVYISLVVIKLPSFIFWGLEWKFIKIWGPNSFPFGIGAIYLTLIFLIVYLQLIFLFPKKQNPSKA